MEKKKEPSRRARSALPIGIMRRVHEEVYKQKTNISGVGPDILRNIARIGNEVSGRRCGISGE